MENIDCTLQKSLSIQPGRIVALILYDSDSNENSNVDLMVLLNKEDLAWLEKMN